MFEVIGLKFVIGGILLILWIFLGCGDIEYLLFLIVNIMNKCL